MTAEEKLAAIMAHPIIGYLWILASMIDFARVHKFKRPIFCIAPAESSFQDSGSGTFTGLWYAFEIKGTPAPEDKLPEAAEYTARILHTPVMAGVWE